MMVPLKHNVHLFHKKVHINQLLVEVVTYQLMFLLPHKMIIWTLIEKQLKTLRPDLKVFSGIILQRSKLAKKDKAKCNYCNKLLMDHRMMGYHI